MKIKLKTKEEYNITKYVEYEIKNGYYHYPDYRICSYDYIFIHVTDDYIVWFRKFPEFKIFVKKMLSENDIRQILESGEISKERFERNYKEVMEQFYILREKLEEL